MEEKLIEEKYVETSYGKVFYISSGRPRDPLYLIVHGSGSASGSHHYTQVLHEYAVRFQPLWPLFLVAIDCPGYGKSGGNKQTIRSYPQQFLKELIQQLSGSPSAFVLMGHSQGGCAIFNAVLEDRTLAAVLVQDRPVCGDVKRLKALTIPTLLVYDSEDAGHPLKQGKQIAKEIPHNQLIVYAGSQEPYWHSDHLFDSILAFLHHFNKLIDRRFFPATEVAISSEANPEPKSKSLPKHRATQVHKVHSTGEQATSKSPLSSPVMGTTAQEQIAVQQHIKEPGDTQAQYSREDPSPSHADTIQAQEYEEENKVIIVVRVQPAPKAIPTNTLHPGQTEGKVSEVNSEAGSKSNTHDLNVLMEPGKRISEAAEQHEELRNADLLSHSIPHNSQQAPQQTAEELKHPELAIKEQKEDNKEGRKDIKPERDVTCPICLELLWEPLKLPCGHYSCLECMRSSYIYNPKCPICRHELHFDEKTLTITSTDTHMGDYIRRTVPPEVLEQRKLKAILTAKSKARAIKVEYGNYSRALESKSAGKQKYLWKLFVKVLSSPVANPIAFVDFQINPQMKGAKPLRVAQPPYELERNGNYEFGCEIEIHWKPSVSTQPYLVHHTVTLGPPKTSRQFLQFPTK